MNNLITAIKSDLNALSSRQSQAAELLSVNATEERKTDALNHVYAMVPLLRDLHSRCDALKVEADKAIAFAAQMDRVFPVGEGELPKPEVILNVDPS